MMNHQHRTRIVYRVVPQENPSPAVYDPTAEMRPEDLVARQEPRAVCECGWRGPWHVETIDAIADGLLHNDEYRGQPVVFE